MVSATGQPTFKFAEQLSAQQLKTYASKPRKDLLKQLETLEKKEAKQAEVQQAVDADPEGTRLCKASAAELKQECRELDLDTSGKKADHLARLLAHHHEKE